MCLPCTLHFAWGGSRSGLACGRQSLRSHFWVLDLTACMAMYAFLLLSGIGQAQNSQANVSNIIVCSLPGASALTVLAYLARLSTKMSKWHDIICILFIWSILWRHDGAYNVVCRGAKFSAYQWLGFAHGNMFIPSWMFLLLWSNVCMRLCMHVLTDNEKMVDLWSVFSNLIQTRHFLHVGLKLTEATLVCLNKVFKVVDLTQCPEAEGAISSCAYWL